MWGGVFICFFVQSADATKFIEIYFFLWGIMNNKCLFFPFHKLTTTFLFITVTIKYKRWPGCPCSRGGGGWQIHSYKPLENVSPNGHVKSGVFLCFYCKSDILTTHSVIFTYLLTQFFYICMLHWLLDFVILK